MSRWFRHYAGMMRDEKLVGVAVRAKQPVERVLWVWGAILESAAEINDEGRYEFDIGEAAYFLRCEDNEIGRVIECLADAERIVEGRVARWGDRQYSSDGSAERQKRYRERRRWGGDDSKPAHKHNGDAVVTSRDAAVTPQETETETETETEKKKDIRAVAVATRPIADDVFEQFWQAYPRRDGANPKTPARKKFIAACKSGIDPGQITEGAKRYRSEVQSKSQEGTPYVAQAVTWLNQQRWTDYGPAPPPQAQRAIGPLWDSRKAFAELERDECSTSD